MDSYLILYSQDGVKQWDVVEAKSPGHALLVLRDREPLILDQIAHVEKIDNADLLALADA